MSLNDLQLPSASSTRAAPDSDATITMLTVTCGHDASVLVVLTRVLPHMLEARKQFAEDKQSKNMDYWNHVLWSQEFGSDGSQYVKWHPGECVYCACVWDSAYHREF